MATYTDFIFIITEHSQNYLLRNGMTLANVQARHMNIYQSIQTLLNWQNYFSSKNSFSDNINTSLSFAPYIIHRRCNWSLVFHIVAKAYVRTYRSKRTNIIKPEVKRDRENNNNRGIYNIRVKLYQHSSTGYWVSHYSPGERASASSGIDLMVVRLSTGDTFAAPDSYLRSHLRNHLHDIWLVPLTSSAWC